MNNLLSHKGEEPEKSVLYIVGTPIGNLKDISPRALNILQNVSLIACEDTRRTKKLINNFEIKNNLISFHKYNSSAKISKYQLPKSNISLSGLQKSFFLPSNSSMALDHIIPEPIPLMYVFTNGCKFSSVKYSITCFEFTNPKTE